MEIASFYESFWEPERVEEEKVAFGGCGVILEKLGLISRKFKSFGRDVKYNLTTGKLVRRLQVSRFSAENLKKSQRQLDIEVSGSWGQN